MTFAYQHFLHKCSHLSAVVNGNFIRYLDICTDHSRVSNLYSAILLVLLSLTLNQWEFSGVLSALFMQLWASSVTKNRTSIKYD